MADFVHLHLHSEYSLLDGACRIKDIAAAAKAAGHHAVAITDHGVMYGAVSFYKSCIDAGIKPIIGCEVYVATRTRFDKNHGVDSSPNHLVLLVKNEIGYKNLSYMVSCGFTEGFYSKPRIDIQLLSEHSEGLIALSACLGGYIPQCILKNDIDEAKRYALEMKALFGDDSFYLELQDHGLEEQEKVNETLLAISRECDIPLVATNDAHYIRKVDADTQAVLLCIQTNRKIIDGRPIGFDTDEFYYKSTEEMVELFGKYPGAIENTVKIADMCNFDFDFKTLYKPKYTTPDGKTTDKYLRELTLKGLDDKIEQGIIKLDENRKREDYKLRVEYELLVISNMGYSDYYLIVWDFINYAKTNKIPTGPGRGSGAGSLVAYLIGITEVDSIKYDLLFERFLNPERVSMPDFDTDFCYDRRDEVIRYVAEKYGSDHVSQIITFGTMAARASVRDVGRALGMPMSEVDAVAGLIPRKPGVTIDEALEIKELRAMYDTDTKVHNLIDIAKSIEGMPRHSSTHAAGVVITDKPIYEYLPLSVNNDTVVTQYDMDTVASLGLLKFDFLALRYLTIISDTEKLIRKNDPRFDIEKLPENDEEAFNLISDGKTNGLFQLESDGMKQMLTLFRPKSVEDIMIAIALYRPGPMDSIPKFLENRRDPSKVTYKIDNIKEILDPTCGCIIYQEQVMQIFRRVAGYSYGRADIVRKAMSKKKQEALEKEREAFLEGAKRNYINVDDASELFDEMAGFAKYAFNKSHAAAYSIISYRTAYLKAHYTAEYFASLLTSVLGNATKTAEYIAEASHYGISILPPDVNESESGFTVSGKNIRFGLSAIKNVGTSFVSSLTKERARAKFTSFEDFIERLSETEINKRQIEALIICGAFDSLGVYRSRLLAVYEKVIDNITGRIKSNLAGQLDLFSASNTSAPAATVDYPDIPEFTFKEKLSFEKQASGLYFSGHILDDYTSHIEMVAPSSIADINSAFVEGSDNYGNVREKQIFTIAGIVAKRTNKMTKNGDAMAFIIVEDRFSGIEVIVFPKQLEKFGDILVYESPISLVGEVNAADDDVKLIIRSCERLVSNDRFDEIKRRADDKAKLECAEYKPQVSENNYQPPVAPQPRVMEYQPSRQTTVHEYQPNRQPQILEYQPQRPSVPKPIPQQNLPGILYIRVPDLEGRVFKRVENLLEIFCGESQVIFYDLSREKYIKANTLTCDATPYVISELEREAGDGNVVLKHPKK